MRVSIDENPGIAERYDAMSIPLLVLLDHGLEIDRHLGAAPESRLAAGLRPCLSTVASERRDA